MSYAKTLPAARVVAVNARDHAEARELLMMLGLVTFDPVARRMVIAPDDDRRYDLDSAGPDAAPSAVRVKFEESA